MNTLAKPMMLLWADVYIQIVGNALCS